jgi:hypothetical protein
VPVEEILANKLLLGGSGRGVLSLCFVSLVTRTRQLGGVRANLSSASATFLCHARSRKR